MKKLITLLSLNIFLLNLSNAKAEEIQENKYPKIIANYELGFLGVLDHKIQFSKDNTYFDYKKSGGQSNLFNISKYSIDLEFNNRHKAVFLYQPLSLSTTSVLEEDMKQDNITFNKGTPMNFLYDFPFFRASYLYDFNEDDFEELSVGVSLQLRNANIEFASLDGTKLVSKRNVGPVPILKFRSRNKINNTWWYASDIDGFYAPISYLNGSNNDVVGAILDSNFKFGANINNKYYPYINLRYIAGGGVGTSNEKVNLGDGYTNNWLHFLAITLGISTQIL